MAGIGIDPITLPFPTAVGESTVLDQPDPATGIPIPYVFNPATGFTGYLFNRTWNIVLLNSFFVPFAYNSLRTVFTVERNSFSSADHAKIEVYNLNSISRRNLLRGGQAILSVGYGGILAPIFTGYFQRCTVERKGPDFISHFECYENQKQLTEPVCNLSFPAGTTNLAVILTIIPLMGLVPGPIIGLIPKVFNSGTVFSGSCKKRLDELTAAAGLLWFVRDFIVYIMPKGSPTVPTPVPVSQSTGMVGHPVLSTATGGDGILTFEHLIVPYLLPGVLVAIKNSDITAPPVVAVIKATTIDGDTHSSKWTIKCQCVQPSAVPS